MQKEILVDNIMANPWNPNVMGEKEFEALKQDMEKFGHKGIQPILVSSSESFFGSKATQEFVIIDGEHRWRIAKELKWATIIAELSNLSEDEAKAICYRRNREHGNIDPFKEASLFKSELELKRSQEDIATKYLIDRSTVSHRLSLLKLDSQVVETVKTLPRGTLTTSHLEPLTTLEPKDQKELIEDIKTERFGPWTVREVEEQAARIRKKRIEEAKLAEALATAKFPKCPKCKKSPTSIHYKGLPWVYCESNSYDHIWNLKTGKTLYQEERVKEKKLNGEQEKQLSGTLRCGYTIEQIKEGFFTAIKRIVPDIELEEIDVSGKFRGSKFSFDINTYSKAMSVSMQRAGKYTGFRAENHDYKTGEKSAVQLGFNPTEIQVEEIKKFIELAINGTLWNEATRLTETVKTVKNDE